MGNETPEAPDEYACLTHTPGKLDYTASWKTSTREYLEYLELTRRVGQEVVRSFIGPREQVLKVLDVFVELQQHKIKLSDLEKRIKEVTAETPSQLTQ